VRACRPGQLPGIGGAVRPGPGAELRDVALARHAPALRGRGRKAAPRTVVARAVACLRDVAVAGHGAADRRALRVLGTRGGLACAVLGQIADAGGAPALGRARLEPVGRAVVAETVAPLRDVALPC